MSTLFLVKRGYGSFLEISNLDTPDFLDLLEYEMIVSDIEYHQMQQSGK